MVKQLPGDQDAVEATCKDILNSIAERDIYTGDGIEMVTVDKSGVHFKRFPLRRD
jgi:20S proteasome alpha/beta subunit